MYFQCKQTDKQTDFVSQHCMMTNLTWGEESNDGMSPLVVGHESPILLLNYCTPPLWPHDDLIPRERIE